MDEHVKFSKFGCYPCNEGQLEGLMCYMFKLYHLTFSSYVKKKSHLDRVVNCKLHVCVIVNDFA